MSGLIVRPLTSAADCVAALQIRLTVFVGEQGVPWQEEVDARDAAAYHLLALQDNRPVGTGRLVVEGDEGIVGRMAVLREARGAGVGSALLAGLLAEARRRALQRVVLSAQLHARPFYARHGFTASGPHFLDGGLPHQRMERALLPNDIETAGTSPV